MKNKYLLTSFIPMLVTAGLLITAPIVREAFYKTVEPETTNADLKQNQEASAIKRTSAFNQKLVNNWALLYAGTQFTDEYKSGTFITPKH